MKFLTCLLPIVFFMMFAPDIFAFEPQLENLKATQKLLQSHRKKLFKNNGGGPELTTFKHQLRDWIESKLEKLDKARDPQELQNAINDSMEVAGLIFKGKDDADEFIGYLDPIQLKRDGDLITLTTGVGILCAYDESAYAYEWKNKKWTRIWESEQTDYSKDHYYPQHFQSIQWLHPYDLEERKNVDWRLVLSLGTEEWCSSNWHNVYWRLWRIDSFGMKLIVDEKQWAFMPYLLKGGFAKGTNKSGEVFVEFKRASIDGGLHNRQAVYHYTVNQDTVHRTDPIALSPRNFVEEWINSTRKDIAEWSSSNVLQKQHHMLKDIRGEFSPTMHCKTPDLWQVTFNKCIDNKDFDKTSPLYFLVRWRPPYHFTMMDVGKKPWPLCNQKDEQADEWRTLFPTEMDH
jgi:hypothetical protein